MFVVVECKGADLQKTLRKFDGEGYDLKHIIFTYVDIDAALHYCLIFRHNPDR